MPFVPNKSMHLLVAAARRPHVMLSVGKKPWRRKRRSRENTE
jgi:hypothetical protein